MGGHEPVRDRVEGLILTATGLRMLGQAPKSSGCVGGLDPASSSQFRFSQAINFT
jgi:hypothetical protein